MMGVQRPVTVKMVPRHVWPALAVGDWCVCPALSAVGSVRMIYRVRRKQKITINKTRDGWRVTRVA